MAVWGVCEVCNSLGGNYNRDYLHLQAEPLLSCKYGDYRTIGLGVPGTFAFGLMVFGVRNTPKPPFVVV